MKAPFQLPPLAIALLVAAAMHYLILSPAYAQPAPAAELAGPLVWPERIPPASDAAAPGIIRPLPGVALLRSLHVGPLGLLKPSDADKADIAALLGPEDNAALEGGGAFIFRAPPALPGLAPPADAKPIRSASDHIVYISARPAANPDDPPRLERTWFAFTLPSDKNPRGLILILPGMFGTPDAIIDQFAARLTREGWAVLRMLAHPSRFTERRIFAIDLADPEPSVRIAAEEMNQRVAECALAVTAAMDDTLAKHPALTPLPRIAIGMSGGAMVLPTVVAREPDRYAAALFIAGGCNFFRLSDQSNYKFLINAVDFRWSPAPPTDEQRDAIDEIYFRLAGFDAYNTASNLHGKPMLMIHASHDMAVPAALGDLLWERLGRPERWVHTAGHEELFIKFPGDTDRIMAWLDRHAKSPAAPADKP